MNIGSRIRRYRKSRGLTQGELAIALNTSTPHISNLEAGKISPKISTLERLGLALGYPTSAFFDSEVTTQHNSEVTKEEQP